MWCNNAPLHSIALSVLYLFIHILYIFTWIQIEINDNIAINALTCTCIFQEPINLSADFIITEIVVHHNSNNPTKGHRSQVWTHRSEHTHVVPSKIKKVLFSPAHLHLHMYYLSPMQCFIRIVSHLPLTYTCRTCESKFEFNNSHPKSFQFTYLFTIYKPPK